MKTTRLLWLVALVGFAAPKVLNVPEDVMSFIMGCEGRFGFRGPQIPVAVSPVSAAGEAELVEGPSSNGGMSMMDISQLRRSLLDTVESDEVVGRILAQVEESLDAQKRAAVSSRVAQAECTNIKIEVPPREVNDLSGQLQAVIQQNNYQLLEQINTLFAFKLNSFYKEVDELITSKLTELGAALMQFQLNHVPTHPPPPPTTTPPPTTSAIPTTSPTPTANPASTATSAPQPSVVDGRSKEESVVPVQTSLEHAAERQFIEQEPYDEHYSEPAPEPQPVPEPEPEPEPESSHKLEAEENARREHEDANVEVSPRRGGAVEGSQVRGRGKIAKEEEEKQEEAQKAEEEEPLHRRRKTRLGSRPTTLRKRAGARPKTRLVGRRPYVKPEQRELQEDSPVAEADAPAEEEEHAEEEEGGPAAEGPAEVAPVSAADSRKNRMEAMRLRRFQMLQRIRG